MAKTTTRWALPYPEGTDAADVPKRMEDLAKALDGVAMDDQGAKASRPAAGKKGKYYFATDEGILYRDNGTSWDAVNYSVAEPALSEALKDRLALSSKRAGKSIIATEQSTESSSFTLLTTPDRVTGIELPENALLIVAYQALWKEGSAATAEAAIFLNENQVRIPSTDAITGSNEPIKQSAIIGSSEKWAPLTSSGAGLYCDSSPPSVSNDSIVSTGQILGARDNGVDSMGGYGGLTVLTAAAGTYSVSVRFRRNGISGKTTAKNRKLWVWVKELP